MVLFAIAVPPLPGTPPFLGWVGPCGGFQVAAMPREYVLLFTGIGVFRCTLALRSGIGTAHFGVRYLWCSDTGPQFGGRLVTK